MNPLEPRTTGILPRIIANTDGLYLGDLVAYFWPILNSRGAMNPYHGFRHTWEVTAKAFLALEYYRDKGRTIDRSLARWLLMATIFHDFDHPGRSGNDDLNVQFALRGLERMIQPQDRRGLLIIQGLIRTTEFGKTGHVHQVGSNEDLRGYEELERVIRDADVSQSFSLAWIQLVCFGLGEEMGFGAEQMLRGQTNFLTNLRMQSEWGQAEYPAEKIAGKIAECRALVGIMNESKVLWVK